jgi:class 3 adenylate cyclase
VIGVAEMLEGRWQEAETHFRSALEVAARVGARTELGRCHLDYARMLEARGEDGDFELGGEHVRHATAIFEELGMWPFLRRAEELARRLDAPARARPPGFETGTEGLSQPEADLLRAASSGESPPLDSRSGGRRERDAACKEGAESPAAPLAIMMTDMKGSTELIQDLGERDAQATMRTHNSILRDCLRESGGTEIQHTGDGVLASFFSASRAVECAVSMQRALARHNREIGSPRIRVRIGVMEGEPMSEEGRLFGAAVNATARLCALAEPEEILVSEGIRNLGSDVDADFRDRGDVQLKGFPEPFHLYEVQW